MNELDRMVQLAGEAVMDASTVHHRTDLANSLSNHFVHFWLRARAGDQKGGAVEDHLAVWNQLGGEPALYINPVSAAEFAIGDP